MDRKGSLKIAMATLGCKTNQSDAACLASELVSQGHEIVPFREAADVYIIHTCTVTQKTDYQSRQLIRRSIAEESRGASDRYGLLRPGFSGTPSVHRRGRFCRRDR